MSEQNTNGVAIVGGGITGLYSALQAADRGQTNIHVYESAQRLGGKIQSTKLGDQVVNLGAEFIDSDDKHLRALCERLNVPLEKSAEQGEEVFQNARGKLVGANKFHAAYAPIAMQVIAHREEMERNPNGQLAQQLKSMPLDQYMEQLRRSTPAVKHPSLLRRFINFVTFHSNRVDRSFTHMAMTSFTHELGRSPQEITAAQFAFESSPSLDRLLVSDCGYRVQGGTEQIIHALRGELEKRGVAFHTGAQLQSLSKRGDATELTFASANGAQQVAAQKVVLALPSYALAKIDGMESMGFTSAHHQLLGDVQYTQNAKFTVKLQPGVKTPENNLFGRTGECWSPAPGYLTFLCHNPRGLQPKALLSQALQDYASAYGTRPDKMFDVTQGNVAVTNPGKAACYSTPSPKNAKQTEALFAKIESLADHGVGITGTYIPFEGTVGFIECGLAASERMADRVFGKAVDGSRGLAQEKTPSFAAREQARRSAAASEVAIN